MVYSCRFTNLYLIKKSFNSSFGQFNLPHGLTFENGIMNIFLIILGEFLFVSALILFLFKIRHLVGLAPLYIFLGSLQYLQTILATSFFITLFDDYLISPGSILLFCSSLFAVLLVYIKEGVASTRSLIFGIVLANIALTALVAIFNFQAGYTGAENLFNDLKNPFLLIDFRIFTIGTVVLVLDFFLLIVIYKYLTIRIKGLKLFPLIFLSLLLIFCFDAIVFTTAAFHDLPTYQTILTSHLIGKSFSAVLFSVVLYFYIRFIDKEKDGALFIADDSADIFSIFTYRKQYEALKIEKELSEEKYGSLIEQAIDGAFITEGSLKFILVNSSASTMLGYTKQELLELTLKDVTLIEKEEKPFRVGEWAQKLTEIHERKMVRKDKSIVTVELNGTRLDNGNYMAFVRDITERKKAEDQLVKSEKYLDNIINNIGDPVFVKDEQSKFLLVNDAFCTLFNFSRADIIGKTLAEEIPQDQIEVFLRIDKEVIATGIENINEELLTVKDGETLTISTRKTRFIDESGNKFLIATIRDITQRRYAEIALKESEEKYRTLSESSLDYIMRYDKAGHHLYMNKAALEISGLNESDVIGKTHQEAGFDAVQSVFWEEKINYVFETGLSVHEQFEWESIKGLVYLDWRLSPEFDENRNVISALGVSRDITDIKLAENAIIASHEKVKESEEKYRTLVEQASDAIFITDPAGNFITVNESACKLANCTEKEMMQMSINDFVSLLELEKNPFHYKELSNGEVVTTEREMLAKGDKKITVEITAKQLVNENLLIFVRDITEKKLAQKQILKTSEELRLLMQHLQNVREEERKRIGREIHDDLGQQLTAIKMYAAWIDKRIPEDNPAIKEKITGIIELLDSSNMSIRKILNELRFGVLDNDGLIDGLKWLCKQFEQTTSIELVFTTNLNKVKASEQTAICVYRILQESLNNITKHAEAKKVMIDIHVTANILTMVIADDGKGFQMEKLRTVNSFGILGMKERVSAAEGEFKLESVKGAGTRLKIAIPV